MMLSAYQLAFLDLQRQNLERNPRQRRMLRELTLIVYYVLQAGVPLGLCSTHWSSGCSVQMEKTLRTLRRIKKDRICDG